MNDEVKNFKRIQKESLELFKKKNKDYGSAYREYGAVGTLMRIEDKIRRFRTISKNKIELVEDEKTRDTIIDMVNYGIIILMQLDEGEIENG